MRILVFQYGDYGDAYSRWQTGGAETYRDQYHSVKFIASLAPKHDVTTVAICERSHDDVLAPGLRSIGVPLELAWDSKRLWPLLDRFDADAFICRTPNRVALTWAARNGLPTLPSFYDSFSNKGLRTRLNNWRLARVMGRCNAPCVANHSLSASRSLCHVGLKPDQIVPIELKRVNPIDKSKDAPVPGEPFRLFYAGMLTEGKGVGECIEAVAIARSKGVDVVLNLAGPGKVDHWTDVSRRHGVEPYVCLLGVITSDRVLTEMWNNDAVIVPSRHDYSEGLPNTIFEALASRSPLIASDHPSFIERLRPEVDSLRFRAADAGDLAEQVVRLARDPELYVRLSRQSAAALSALYVGIEWTELVSLFVDDPTNARAWTKGLTLADRPGLGGHASIAEPARAKQSPDFASAL